MFGADEAREAIREILATVEFDPVEGTVVFDGFPDPRMKRSGVSRAYRTIDQLVVDLAEIGDEHIAAETPFEGGKPVFDIDSSDIVWDELSDHEIERYFADIAETDEAPETAGGGAVVIRGGLDGRLVVGLADFDGTWTFPGGHQRLPSGIYTVVFTRWATVLAELEELINDSSTNESDLQKFFEAHPQLLRGHDYENVIPQANISRVGIDDGPADWKADFVLSPIEQEDFCKVIDLKRPQLGSVRPPKSGHPAFYAALREGIEQLRDYCDAFDSEAARRRFNDEYGVDVYKPELQLIIGRRWDEELQRAMKDRQRRDGIEISSWDGQLTRLRRMFT